jgi:spore germination protein KA
MDKLPNDTTIIINEIKRRTGSPPDLIFKTIPFYDTYLHIIFSESMSDRTTVNDFVLEYFQFNFSEPKRKVNILKYLKAKIPANKISIIDGYDELLYNLLSGLTIILVDGFNQVLSIETRAKLDSGVSEAQNEKIVKGPKDAFTENYQTNIGLVRKRIKSENLWLEEFVLGTKSKTKVGIIYLRDVASKDLVEEIIDKIKKINIDSILDSNYIIELISENRKNAFPNYISTERPDRVNMSLLNGKIAIIVENTPYAIVVPAVFADFFRTTEDLYEKSVNANYVRIIRLIALIVTLFAPALYIAVATHNYEAIPEGLLINFASQREGVPFPSFIEALLMLTVFEILKETDLRIPTSLGSALGIVGALVLGEAAVTAGLVSPIMVIVIALTAISGLIVSAVAITNAIRLWRLAFLLGASLLGILGIFIASLFFLINITSIKSFGVPYFAPIAPFYKEDQDDTIILSDKRKFTKRSILTSKKNIHKQGVEKTNEIN